MFKCLVPDFQFAIERMPLFFKWMQKPLVEPFCSFEISQKKYQLKVALTAEEIFQVLKLRFKVFYQEFSTRKIRFSFLPIDIDLFDLKCDHLIVKDIKTKKVVACYRLLHSEIAQGDFYSGSEFDLSKVNELEGNKLELGRAAVHKDYRNGTVIGLLWKGLLHYAQKTNTRFMFGCSSLNRMDFGSFDHVKDMLSKRNALLCESFVNPKPSFHNIIPLQSVEKKQEVNSLMQMYILAGAKLSMNAAYDQEMDCLDLFTLIDLREMPEAFERRFAC